MAMVLFSIARGIDKRLENIVVFQNLALIGFRVSLKMQKAILFMVLVVLCSCCEIREPILLLYHLQIESMATTLPDIPCCP